MRAVGGRAAYLLTACLAMAVSLGVSAPAGAACVRADREQLRKRAEVIVKGVFPRRIGNEGALLSPARFRVFEYRKGDGPDQLAVETATEPHAGGIAVNSEGIFPKAGERWILFGRLSRANVLRTSVCDGSERRRAAT